MNYRVMLPYGMFPLGFATGILGALIGVGGGFLYVPILIYIYNFPQTEAAGTSLLTVTIGALAASIGYMREGKIESWGGLRFAAAGVPGGIAGAMVSGLIKGIAFKIAFAIMLLILAGVLLTRHGLNADLLRKRVWRQLRIGTIHRRRVQTTNGEQFRFIANEPLGMVGAAVSGCIGGMLGIGGGVLFMPILLYLVGYPAQIAAATAQITVLATAATGAISHAWLGHIDYYAALMLGGGALVGGPLGVILARHVNTRPLTLILSVLLVLSAIRMVIA